MVVHVMVLYLSDLTNIGYSFIFLTVNLFRHSTLIKHGLYSFPSYHTHNATVLHEIYQVHTLAAGS